MPSLDQSSVWHEWIAKAQDDEDAAEILFREGGPFSPVCFHAQQMAEKLLKGFLTYYDKPFRKAHDLVELAGMLSAVVPDILDALAEELTLLNRFYIEARYPADVPEFYRTDAQKALEAARKVKEFIMKAIQRK